MKRRSFFAMLAGLFFVPKRELVPEPWRISKERFEAAYRQWNSPPKLAAQRKDGRLTRKEYHDRIANETGTGVTYDETIAALVEESETLRRMF